MCQQHPGDRHHGRRVRLDRLVLYGFAANDVTGVDVVVDGTPQPATMLPNAYTADLGTHDLSEATSLIVHHADGKTTTVANTLQAPPSA